MAITIDAIYENGLSRPLGPLPVVDNARVRITVDSDKTWADATAGTVPRPADVSVLEHR